MNTFFPPQSFYLAVANNVCLATWSSVRRLSSPACRLHGPSPISWGFSTLSLRWTPCLPTGLHATWRSWTSQGDGQCHPASTCHKTGLPLSQPSRTRQLGATTASSSFCSQVFIRRNKRVVVSYGYWPIHNRLTWGTFCGSPWIFSFDRFGNAKRDRFITYNLLV